MTADNLRNFIIFYNNLSTFYVTCVLISVVAVILTWIYHFKYVSDNLIDGEKLSKECLEIDSAETELKQILNTLKETKKQKIEKYAASLTEDQLEEEKKIEREQLSAILKLLKEQEEKFHVASMEELEGQLKLYR